MTKRVFCSGAETTDKIEFDTSGPNAANVNTNVKTGSRSFELDYNITSDVIACQLSWSKLPTYFNWSCQLHIRLQGTPLEDLTLVIDNSSDEDSVGFSFGAKLEITSVRTLKLTSNGSTTGSTVLNVGQYYRVEVRSDFTCDKKIYLRIDGVDELNVTANTAASKATFGWGEINKASPPVAGAVLLNIDDIVLWTSSSSGLDELPPWLNAQSCDYRNVNGNGIHTGFTGIGFSDVNDFQPHDGDNTFNESGGVAAITTKDSYLATDKVISDTVVGFMACHIIRFSYDDDSESDPGGTFNFIIRDNGVDFDTEFISTVANTYGSNRIGHADRPNGGAALDDPIMDALEIGLSARFELHTDLASYYGSPNSGAGDNASLEPTSDSAAENDWDETTTLGGPFGKWEIIDNDISDDFTNDQDGDGDVDFIFTSTEGDKQGFKVPADTVGARIITGVTIRGFTSGPASAVGGTVRFYFKDSVGTFHFSSAISVAIGAIQIKRTFSNNPETGNPWTMAEITGGEWGIESFSLPATKEHRLLAFNVCVNYRSKIRITSAFIVTAHGDAITEFICRAKKKVNSGILGFSKVGGRLVG